MFVLIVRSLWVKRMYHAVWGRRLLQGASAVIATSEQEVEELEAGGFPRTRVVLRRNGVGTPPSLPERGKIRKLQSLLREETAGRVFERPLRRQNTAFQFEALSG